MSDTQLSKKYRVLSGRRGDGAYSWQVVEYVYDGASEPRINLVSTHRDSSEACAAARELAGVAGTFDASGWFVGAAKMSDTKHTPGPWHWETELWRQFAEDPVEYMQLVSAETVVLSDPFYSSRHAISCKEADARLIAAAPELLEALKSCVEGLGCQPGYVNTLALSRAQAAIDRAEGR
jgi:hypothetical protein